MILSAPLFADSRDNVVRVHGIVRPIQVSRVVTLHSENETGSMDYTTNFSEKKLHIQTFTEQVGDEIIVNFVAL